MAAQSGPPVNLVQMRYFIKVAATKSFTRAAVELGVAQPAITRQIKMLEAELGGELLVRHRRGIELTDVGALLLDRAEFILRAIDQARVEAMDLSGAPSGSIRVGCAPALSCHLMVGPLKLFATRYPKVSIELHESISDQLYRAVLADQLDMAVLSARSHEPYLQFTPLFSEEIWLFGAPGLVGGKGRASLDRLAKVPLLLARRTNPARQLIERHMADAGLPMNIVIETDSVQVIRDLVMLDVGCAAAPYLSFADQVRCGAMRGGPIENVAITRSLVRRKDRPLSRAAREFLAVLQDETARFIRAQRSRGVHAIR
jgi:LysR family transcriptional regulator, nitrogen assimilation regulatory protein